MSDLTSKGIPLLGEADADKRQSVNTALVKIDQLLGTKGGSSGATTSTKAVPVNTDDWTDTGIVLTGTDALSIRASGAFRFSAGNPLLDADGEGGAYLYFCVVDDGTVPTGDVAGQFIYAEQRAIVGKSGRVWARVRDVGGAGDNEGDLSLDLLHFEDTRTTFAQLLHLHDMDEVRGLEAALASKIDVAQRGVAGGVATLAEDGKLTPAQAAGGGWTLVSSRVVPAGGAGQIEVPAIPQNFKRLRLIVSARVSTNYANTTLNFNQDISTTFYSFGSSSKNTIFISCNGQDSVGFALFDLMIENYAATNATKTVAGTAWSNKNTSNYAYNVYCVYTSNAPITSLALLGNFVEDTRLEVYAI